MALKTKSRDGTKEIEVYLSGIDRLTDEYINTLADEDDIYRAQGFLGLLKYIYINMFRPDRNMPHNSNSILVNASAQTISDVWDKFTALCYRFRNTPTILKFACMSGIDRQTIETWRKGEWRSASPEYSRTAQKMFTESECALESKAVESNGIGSIFALKSCFQWRETAPIGIQESTQIDVHETAEQIAARHANAALPEKPDFD